MICFIAVFVAYFNVTQTDTNSCLEIKAGEVFGSMLRCIWYMHNEVRSIVQESSNSFKHMENDECENDVMPLKIKLF